MPRFDEPVSFTINLISPVPTSLPGAASSVLAQNETVTVIGVELSPSNDFVVLQTFIFHSPPVSTEVTSRALEPSPAWILVVCMLAETPVSPELSPPNFQSLSVAYCAIAPGEPSSKLGFTTKPL